MTGSAPREATVTTLVAMDFDSWLPWAGLAYAAGAAITLGFTLAEVRRGHRLSTYWVEVEEIVGGGLALMWMAILWPFLAWTLLRGFPEDRSQE